MRSTVEIPAGDLFTVMETWTDGERIKRSMDAILEIEAVAAAESEAMPGLLELLNYLRTSPARVGLVTRNTPQSVDAFFAAIGEEWRGAFDILLTREHPYVKPDKRCLLHFSDAWGIPPHKLLMVGDSTEDVECGNAAGTATCLIAGGGNETSGVAAAPPPGAVPTFLVESLHDLLERLQKRDTALGWGSASISSFDESSESEGEMSPMSSLDFDADAPGAPPPGLEFLDWLYASGAVEAASCSFPRIDGSRFGTPEDDHPGSKVLHIQCGNGALTKLLFSAGLLVVGADPEPASANKRGLFASKVERLDQDGALEEAADAVGAFDVAVLFGDVAPDGQGLEAQIWRPEALAEIARVVRPEGSLCLEIEVQSNTQAGIEQKVKEALGPAGFELKSVQVLRRSAVTKTDRVRLVAVRTWPAGDSEAY